VQHGIDGRREQSEVPEPGSAAIVKETAYPLHLSRREPISFTYHKALFQAWRLVAIFLLRCINLPSCKSFNPRAEARGAAN
jgi:hypothetical protein